MDWVQPLFFGGHGVANGIIAISVVAVCGLAVGELKIGVVKLGIAGPLFVGIAFGHFGLKMEMEILEFAREFGLMIFVYGVGIMVGPTFMQSFKKDGALLNAFAAFIVIFGAVIAVGLHYGFGLPLEVVVGLFSGGTTNTPSLAAGMQMLKELKATSDQIAVPGQAYAIAYPFGIIGILITMGLVRMFFRVDVPAEADSWLKKLFANRKAIETMSIDVRNAGVAGKTVSELSDGIVISRILRAGAQHAVIPNEALALGDTVLAVGPRAKIEALRDILGAEAAVKLQDVQSPVQAKRFVVTNSKAFGKTISSFVSSGVVITRLTRGGHELVPDSTVKLEYADQVMCVGEEGKMAAFNTVLGNDAKVLQHTQMIPIFIGLFLGVFLGSIPFFIPGLPAPIKLGMAGGPVIIAILLSHFGSIGPLVWRAPPAAISAIREIGITLFMCCVGIYAGKSFINTVLHGDGLKWMLCATLITFVPLVISGFLLRAVFKVNYLTVCGVLAGSMTDPPALAFANAIYPSDAQGTGYAAVYPLTMCLRILAPQVILAALWAVS
jgi:putative transport protein